MFKDEIKSYILGVLICIVVIVGLCYIIYLDVQRIDKIALNTNILKANYMLGKPLECKFGGISWVIDPEDTNYRNYISQDEIFYRDVYIDLKDCKLFEKEKHER